MYGCIWCIHWESEWDRDLMCAKILGRESISFVFALSLTGRDIRTGVQMYWFIMFVKHAHVNTAAFLYSEKPSDCQEIKVKQLVMFTMVFWPHFQVHHIYSAHRACKLVIWKVNTCKYWCTECKWIAIVKGNCVYIINFIT